MKNVFKGFVIFFMIITALIAGIGLIIIDQSLGKVIDPVRLTEIPSTPDMFESSIINLKNNDDDKLSAIYVYNPDSSHVIYYLHDGKGNLFSHIPIIEHLLSYNVSLLAIDYRGFGLSDDVDISDETLVEDIVTGYEMLRRYNWRSWQIIFYCRGIFCGALGQITDDLGGHSWIMENPVPSLQDAMKGKITRLLTKNRLSLYDSLNHFDGNVMVLFDQNAVDKTILSKLRAINSDFIFCQVSGELTMYTDFLKSRTQCLESFLFDINSGIVMNKQAELLEQRTDIY